MQAYATNMQMQMGYPGAYANPGGGAGGMPMRTSTCVWRAGCNAVHEGSFPRLTGTS